MKQGIVVIGSANYDFVYRVAHIPRPGETIIAKERMTNPGGKGANQAVAAARAGGIVHFIACVGKDSQGERLLESMGSSGVKGSGIRILEDQPTGMANIYVSDDGENCILVLPGANEKVDIALLDEQDELLRNGQIVVCQLEIPLPTVCEALKRAHAYGAVTVLNPSPVQLLPDELLQCVDILIPNETEMAALIGHTPSDEELKAYAVQKQIGTIVLTLGGRGCCIVTKDQVTYLPCRSIEAVDTTGAGDTFLGALATRLGERYSIEEAAQFAMAASAITVSRIGAQQAMPYRAEIPQGITPDLPTT
ncbi:MAG: ribokinase [Eubacteriales bacterium]|nr:ribokinase [Eubacteriales bacterium]